MPHTHTHTHIRTNTPCSHGKESRVAQHCTAKSKDAASTKATREWWQVLTSGLLGGCAYPVLSLDVVNGLMLRYLLSDLSEQALVWSVKISFTYHIIYLQRPRWNQLNPRSCTGGAGKSMASSRILKTYSRSPDAARCRLVQSWRDLKAVRPIQLMIRNS